MRWCLVRHPDLDGQAVVAEDSLQHHEYRGWVRGSGWADDPHTPIHAFPPYEADEPDPATEPAPAKPAKTSKENS